MKADNNISAARRAYEKRDGVKFTQEDAAREFGVSLSAYRNYEQEVNLPNASVIAKIASKYGTSVEYLLCRTDDPRPFVEHRVMSFKADEKELLELYGKLNKEQREAVLSTMRAMIG